MSNNKEIICKLIKAKNQEANSYTDQTCYNAAYCYGYVDGATMALNTLSDVPERHKCYAILSHYSNEDIGTFDSVAICGGVHMSFESAKKAADEMLAVDKENECHNDAVPYTLDDCKEFDDLPLYIAGEWSRTNLNTITTFTLYLNRMQRCRKQNTGGALMFKVLGGIGRSVPLYNGKARILVKAIIPVASSYLADMQSICEANGWKSVLDERGNLVVLSVVSIDAYRLSDSTLMTAYLHFAETAAQKLTGNKNRYLVAGVVSYDAAA